MSPRKPPARGPLAIVRTGDRICLNVPERKLDLLLPEEEISHRLNDWHCRQRNTSRGYPRLYIDHVLGRPIKDATSISPP